MILEDETNKIDSLIGLSQQELSHHIQALGGAKFRAKQLYGWIYKKGVADFAAMHTLDKGLRTALTHSFTLARPKILKDHIAEDGTRKWLIGFKDNAAAEMVFIPEETRGTLCLSSQVGCTLTCRFCHTGTQKWVRNLTADEIVGQLLLAKDLLEDWEHPSEERRQITNLVFMGMGEPLLNTDAVIKAVQCFTDGDGLALTKRRVTVSTSGIAPELQRLGEECGAALAISLHAVEDDLRNQLVPINRKYNLQSLMDAIRAYPTLSNARRVTFEYIMLNEVNDRKQDARGLIRLIQGIPAKINLIPFNPWPGADYLPSTDQAINQFAEIVRKAGFTVTVRKTRGQDILAACGQLKSASLRLSARERQAIEETRQLKDKAFNLETI